MSTEVVQPTAGTQVPEKVLAEFGKQVLSFNSLFTWSVLLLLLIAMSYFAVRWYRMRKKSSVGMDKMFYNPKRRHSRANGLSHVEYEKQYLLRLGSV